MQSSILTVPDDVKISDKLQFLWLELTNHCNLECVHCYAGSSPEAPLKASLNAREYFEIIDAAADMGCWGIQFIGGEPTLVPELPQYIRRARSQGIEYLEVFTNAVDIPQSLVEIFRANHVNIAVSIYSDVPTVHDKVTQVPGSHEATIRSLHRLLDAGLEVRASIVEMPVNAGRVKATEQFCKDLGIRSIRVDKIRGFGRGARLKNGGNRIQELCGYCWQGRLAISPSGMVSPCIMSKGWPVGSVRKQSLKEIVESSVLSDIRKRIYLEVWAPQNEATMSLSVDSDERRDACGPDSRCGPDSGCGPDRGWPCGPEGISSVDRSARLNFPEPAGILSSGGRP